MEAASGSARERVHVLDCPGRCSERERGGLKRGMGGRAREEKRRETTRKEEGKRKTGHGT